MKYKLFYFKTRFMVLTPIAKPTHNFNNLKDLLGNSYVVNDSNDHELPFYTTVASAYTLLGLIRHRNLRINLVSMFRMNIKCSIVSMTTSQDTTPSLSLFLVYTIFDQLHNLLIAPKTLHEV
jgi:hypothetical protein